MFFCVLLVEVFRCGVIIMFGRLNSGFFVVGLVVNMFKVVLVIWFDCSSFVSVVLLIRLL